MTRVLDELSALLKLEVIEQGLYRGQSQDLGYERYLVVRSWGKHSLPHKRPLPLIVMFTRCIPIFYGPVMLVYLWFMMLKLFVMAQVLALAVSKQYKKVKLSFI